MEKYRKIFGWVSVVITVAILFIPLILSRHVGDLARHIGYRGYFFLSCLGVSTYTLPFLVKKLDPMALVLIGSFGLTLDEFFPWYAGKVADTLDESNGWYRKVQTFVKRHGLYAVFSLSLIPLPGGLYAVSDFAAGHFGIPFYKFFTVNFLGKLVRTTIIVIVLLAVL
jgi:membrane protein DedA with SNARE-associated domain